MIDGYVLRNIETKKYVAVAGLEHSYTSRLEEAQIYQFYEDAIKNACPESDIPIALNRVLRTPKIW